MNNEQDRLREVWDECKDTISVEGMRAAVWIAVHLESAKAILGLKPVTVKELKELVRELIADGYQEIAMMVSCKGVLMEMEQSQEKLRRTDTLKSGMTE